MAKRGPKLIKLGNHVININRIETIVHFEPHQLEPSARSKPYKIGLKSGMHLYVAELPEKLMKHIEA
jgi:hypothetical protein